MILMKKHRLLQAALVAFILIKPSEPTARMVVTKLADAEKRMGVKKSVARPPADNGCSRDYDVAYSCFYGCSCQDVGPVSSRSALASSQGRSQSREGTSFRARPARPVLRFVLRARASLMAAWSR